MFAGKARNLPTLLGSTRKVVHSGKLRPCLQILDKAREACHGKTLQLITKIAKMFHDIGPRAQYYVTFYGNNCWRVVISESVSHFASLPP
jgi:hypothetical protein